MSDSKMSIRSVIAAVVAAAPLVSAQTMGWADSYSINGKCYCQTTYDHNIGGIMVDGPNGKITVREACGMVGSGPEGDRVYYNDVQCGNGPANDAGDEDWCPGRVDMGDNDKSGCMMKGPKWDFNKEAPVELASTPPPPPPPTVPVPPAPVVTQDADVSFQQEFVAPKPEAKPEPPTEAPADGQTMEEMPGLNGPWREWADSYAIDGKCYCDISTLSFNVGDKMVDGPNGQITVREACALIGSGPEGDRKYYNDVQCGNGPANDNGDESMCPGRVDMGEKNAAGCYEKGPKWVFPTSTPMSEEAGAFMEQAEEPMPGKVLTGLSVTSPADGSSSPLGGTIVLADYPSGFGIRAEVSDDSMIYRVQFSASTGFERSEFKYYYDMFGSTGSWPNPPAGGVAVVTVTAYKTDLTSETMEANIEFV